MPSPDLFMQLRGTGTKNGCAPEGQAQKMVDVLFGAGKSWVTWRVSKTAQWVKALTTQPGHLGPISGTHKGEGETHKGVSHFHESCDTLASQQLTIQELHTIIVISECFKRHLKPH